MERMRAGPTIAAATVVATSAIGSVVLTGAGTFSGVAIAITVVSLWTLTLIAAAGILLARGRWSRWASIAVPLLWIAVAVAADAGTAAVLGGVGVTAITGFGVGPLAVGWIRQRPTAGGPPPIAVALLLSLVTYPAFVALVDAHNLGALALVAAICSLAAAGAYSRGGAIGILSLRVLTPAAVFFAGVAVGWPRLTVVVIVGVVLIVLSWARPIRDAAAPVVPTSAAGYRVPPELAPREVLDAAGLDEHGHRK